MTTPSSASPFGSDIKTGSLPAQPSAGQTDFLIRTMQDDLASMQSKGQIEEQKVEVSHVETPAPTPQQTFIPESNPLETMAPFPQERIVDSNVTEIVKEEAVPESTTDNKPTSIKIIMSIVVVLIIGIIGLGIYYFLLTKKSSPAPVVSTAAPLETNPVESTPAATDEQETEPSVTIVPITEKYSKEKPNYLTIDINILSSEEIKSEFIKVSNNLLDSKPSDIYEFVVVDANNNPISFPIFATAAKLNLSPTLLSSLDNDFSFYFYNDNLKMRLAVNATVAKKDLLAKELVKQEKTFVIDGTFLFLNNSPETKTGSFATSNYNNHDIRFLNVNTTKDLSIDYLVTDSRLVIGTSKNTTRAVLDKLNKELTVTDSPINKSSVETTTSENAADVVTSTANISTAKDTATQR